jgi:hypothetical protein
MDLDAYTDNAIAEYRQHRPVVPTSTSWQVGQSGNTSRKATQARDRVSQRLLNDLREDWEIHGKKAIEDVRLSSPEAYCKLVVSVLPREVIVKSDIEATLADMTLEDVRAELEALGYRSPAIIDG